MKGRRHKRNNDDSPIQVRDARATNWGWFEYAAMDRYAKEIGPYAWTVYTYLIRRADKDGQCYPSYKTIAKDLGIGRTSVYNAVNVLQEKGLIEVEARIDELSGDPTSHIYTVLGVSPDEPPQPLNESPSAAERTGVYHDVNPNNTHVNKIQEQENDPRERIKDSEVDRFWGMTLDYADLPDKLLRDVRAMQPLAWGNGVLTLHAPAYLARRRSLPGELVSRLAPVAPVELVEVRIVNGQ